jgi:hypothetical protein
VETSRIQLYLQNATRSAMPPASAKRESLSVTVMGDPYRGCCDGCKSRQRAGLTETRQSLLKNTDCVHLNTVYQGIIKTIMKTSSSPSPVRLFRPVLKTPFLRLGCRCVVVVYYKSNSRAKESI